MDCCIDVSSNTTICVEYGRKNGAKVKKNNEKRNNSNKKENKFVLRFYNLILLPRVRDDIDEYKKLNFHLYMVKTKRSFSRTSQQTIKFIVFQGIEKSFVQTECFFQRSYPSIM